MVIVAINGKNIGDLVILIFLAYPILLFSTLRQIGLGPNAFSVVEKNLRNLPSFGCLASP